MFTTTFSSDSDIINFNSNIPPSTRELSAAKRVRKTNIPAQDELIAIMLTRFEKLVERGYLAPHYLQKMASDPFEVLKFLHQNRAVVHDQLNRRLDPRVRPTPQDLESKGIIPSGYWEFGHEITVKHRHSLLFLTIQEALKKSCVDTQRQEHDVLSEMEEMNNEMKKLRDTLDKYFLSAQPAVDFEKDEQMVREKFHTIQEKLLKISGKQNRIHDKLRILHNVENSMIDLQNTYEQNIKSLVIHETMILNELHAGVQDQNANKVKLDGQISAIYDGKRNLRRKVKERIYELLTQVNVANSITINFIQ